MALNIFNSIRAAVGSFWSQGDATTAAGPALFSGQPEYMRVQDIAFSQSSVSSTFSDGTLLAVAQHKLMRKEIKTEDFPPIRVVHHEGRWTTLDNRRLRVFMDAAIAQILVIKCDCSDLRISRELYTKKSVKFLAGGGTIRRNPSSNAQHFEEGVFVFNKRVLNWTIEQIGHPMPTFQSKALADVYDTRDEYYNSLQPLIFEEARAILQIGIEEAKSQCELPFELELAKFRAAKNPENPTEMKFNFVSACSTEPGDVWLLQNAQNRNARLIAIRNYSESDPNDWLLSCKVVVDQQLQERSPETLIPGARWNGKLIGSFITLRRMYEAVTDFQNNEETMLENSVVRGNFQQGPAPLSAFLQEQEIMVSLNSPQREAVEKFLKIKQGMQLIQGPPGTGKTTTLIPLLRAMQQRGERILVCAPSNKAVQILAERFIEDYPAVPAVLVGTEDKLPKGSPLYRIFFDTWCDRQCASLRQLAESLLSLHPSRLDLKHPASIKDRVRQQLDQITKKFLTFANEIAIYQFPFLSDLNEKKIEFLTASQNYAAFIYSQRLTEWEKSKNYYEMSPLEIERKAIEIPQLINDAGRFVKALSNTMSSLEQTLQLPDITNALLNRSQILFMTLSVSGQQRLKKMDPVNTLIIDEASQATEAETIIPFQTLPQKCLLVGDIKQLPATVLSQEAKRLKFDRSMMERLIDGCCYPHSMLTIQYRMHPEICRWPSQQYYQSRLTNHESVSDPKRMMSGLENAHPFLAPYSFIHVEGKEASGPSGSSFVNQEEIHYTQLILNHLHQRHRVDVVNQVGIITFYKAQADAMQERFKRAFPKIKVSTVDGFQGGESDMVIISCVRANFNSQIGFLKDAKRLNVALTRAKFSLIILGHADTLVRNDLADMVEDARSRNRFYLGSKLQELKLPAMPQPSKARQSILPPPSYHTPQGPVNHPPQIVGLNFKTELCHYFDGRPGSCRMGDQCQFAHGEHELRSLHHQTQDVERRVSRKFRDSRV